MAAEDGERERERERDAAVMCDCAMEDCSTDERLHCIAEKPQLDLF